MNKMVLMVGALFLTTHAYGASSFVKDEYEDVLKKTTKQDYSACWKARYLNKAAFIESFMKDAQKVANLEKKIDEVCKTKVPVGKAIREKSVDIYYVMYQQDKEPVECKDSPDTKEEHARGKSWYVPSLECDKRVAAKK